ncbi:MAG: hypothetical protein NUW02_01425 [Candidatus Campbellbacteria bacterium]|nr:hypothetical protein [Candidatus Campbellbacteria bacterium]
MTFLKKVCPVCTLVALTWLSMFVFKVLGYAVNNELLAMLMGGSVVGISYTLAARLRPVFHKPVTMYWKLITIPLGFIAMYATLQFMWWYTVGAVGIYALVWAVFNGMFTATEKGEHLEDITKALDTCCE